MKKCIGMFILLYVVIATAIAADSLPVKQSGVPEPQAQPLSNPTAAAPQLEAQQSVSRNDATAPKVEEKETPQIPSGTIADLGSKKEKVRLAAVGTLKTIGTQEAAAALINALGNTSMAVRLEVIKVLGDIKNTVAAAPIGKILKEDKEQKIRLAAADYFGRVGTKDDIPFLAAALGDKDMKVRMAALVGLDHVNAPEIIPAVSKALADKTVEMRLKALDVLVNTKSKLIIAPAKKALKDSDKEVRVKAIESLGSIEDKEALSALGDAIDDKDLDLR
ncbi:MAG: HEAT repeat domain-containing protein, partial [Elusimicrobiota bacterium]